MTYRLSETCCNKITRNLTTTACFIHEAPSGCLPAEDSPWMKHAVVIRF